MIRDLVISSQTNEQRLEWEKKWGTFNDFPPNWTEVTANDYWHTRSIWAPRTTEYRQMYDKTNANWQRLPSVTATLEFYGDSPFYPQGMAVVVGHSVYNHVTGKSEYTPKFYKFAACVHEWDPAKTVDTIRGWHERTCKKCGAHVTWDSGD